MSLTPTMSFLALLTLSVALPAQELREMSTDRPDTTESPYTVDRGHVQAEFELVSWGRDRVGDVTTTTLASTANLKYGLCDEADLQVVVGVVRVRATGLETVEGMDDLTVRLKCNLWGQSSGEQPTAFALMPFVTLSTHSKELDAAMGKDTRAFGLIAPLSVSLPAGWDTAVMAEVDVVRNAEQDGWTHELMLTWTAAHDIIGDLGGFVELVNIAKAEEGSSSEAYFDAGLTYALTPQVQLDAGANIGLTRDSEDVRVFSGFSFKL